MIELLQKLFIGHRHKWVERSVHPMKINAGDDIAQGYLVVLKCEVCGTMKNHKIADRKIF